MAQRRAKKRLPRSVYSALIAGAEARRHARRQPRGVRRARVRAARRGPAARAGHGHDRDGPDDLAAGADLADRRAGGPPRRRGRGRPRGGRTRHRDRPQLVREQAGRGGGRGQPADVLPDLLVRLARADRRAGRTRPRRRRGRDDRHARLDVLAQPRLGQPVDPGADRPQGDGAARARGRSSGLRWLADWARAGGPAGPDRPEHDRARRAAADVLRRLRRVDADAARRPGRTCAGCASSGTARSCSRASPASTTPAARSTPA